MPRLRAFRFPTLAIAALAAQPALAQINEADRLARCQNNREAYARVEAEYRLIAQQNDWSPEGIARARTALASLRRDAAEYRRIAGEAEDLNHPVVRAPIERMRRTAASVGLFCTAGDTACALSLPDGLAREIDLAMAGRQPQQLRARQMAQYRTNLIALRCDQVGTVIAVDTAIPNFAGSWRGAYFNADYILSQSGASVGWTSASIGETARGDFANGVLTMTWNGRRGQGTATGTVVTDANGVATEIRWSNGNVFRRQ